MEKNGKRIIFDIDGTICPIKGTGERYDDLVPDKVMVERMREYKEQGAVIVLFTSRNMNSYQGHNLWRGDSLQLGIVPENCSSQKFTAS